MRFDLQAVERVHDGFFKLDRYRLRHELFDGSWTEPMEREILERGHAVAVLPYDPDTDKVLLIEQFRAGALDAPGGPWLTEIIAGMIEPGEKPDDVAYRESQEEAGLSLSSLLPLTRYWVSPGGTTESIYLFLARFDSQAITTDRDGLVEGAFGVRDEHEDIRVRLVSSEQAFKAVEEGLIVAAAPIMALLWLRNLLNEERLTQVGF